MHPRVTHNVGFNLKQKWYQSGKVAVNGWLPCATRAHIWKFPQLTPSGVVCPLYIHAHILFLLHGATVDVVPYRLKKKRGRGVSLYGKPFERNGSCVFSCLRVIVVCTGFHIEMFTTSMASVGNPRSYMIHSSLSWCVVVLNADVISTMSAICLA